MSKTSVDRSEFLAALEACLKLNLGKILNLSGCVRLSFGNEALEVETSNHAYWVTRKVPAMGYENWSSCVPAERLKDAVNELSEGECCLETEGKNLVLTQGKTTYKLVTQDVRDWPEFFASGVPTHLQIPLETLDLLSSMATDGSIGDFADHAVTQKGPVTQVSSLVAGVQLLAQEVALFKGLGADVLDVEVYTNVHIATTPTGRVVAPVDVVPVDVVPVDASESTGTWTFDHAEGKRALQIARAYGASNVTLTPCEEGLAFESESDLGRARTVIVARTQGNPAQFYADTKHLASLIDKCKGDITFVTSEDKPGRILDASRPKWAGHLNRLVEA